MEDVMSLLAKLLTLSAIKTQDADGTDELVMSRAGDRESPARAPAADRDRPDHRHRHRQDGGAEP